MVVASSRWTIAIWLGMSQFPVPNVMRAVHRLSGRTAAATSQQASRPVLAPGPPGENDGAMTLFRPCIDLHEGQVKQIVGGTLTDQGAGRTNFVSQHGPEWYAR